jgi:putative methyltransferase (TIGR04325 family)
LGRGASEILSRVVAATREVVAGRAAYERDTVLFFEPAPPFHIVSVLLRSALRDGGQLEVIDFGGSLGTTYRQCRPFISGLVRLQWHVIEQPHFADAGRREFSNAELHFHDSVGDVRAATTPFTFIFSSVLQYLEHPDDVLRSLQLLPGSHLMIDRSPFSHQDADRLCIQRAPRNVYKASYPCWIFSKDRVLRLLEPHWKVICDFPSPEGAQRTSDGLRFEFSGLMLERRS